MRSLLDSFWSFVSLSLSIFSSSAASRSDSAESHERKDSDDSLLAPRGKDLHQRIASALNAYVYDDEPGQSFPLGRTPPDTHQEPLSAESLARPTSIFIPASGAPHKCKYIEPQLHTPYNPKNAWHDIPGVAYTFELFFTGKLDEAEQWCKKSDPRSERMYISMALGCIQCLKGLMSFASEDLLQAVESTKVSSEIALYHRKKAPSLWVSFSSSDATIEHFTTMAPSELHAELVYAESLCMKSLLNIALAGDLIAFVKELMNVKTCVQIYRSLGRYIEHIDGQDKSQVDPHLRSGTSLGLGIMNIILSMMPQRLLSVIQLFGIKGDKETGLRLLMSCGGWEPSPSSQPSIPPEDEGARRPLADLAVIVFHTLSPTYITAHIDLNLTESMLKWSCDRYRNGPFHQILQGELEMKRSRPAEAIGALQPIALMAASPIAGFRNLSYMAMTETAVALMSLGNFGASESCWRTLQQNASWSKAIYTYGLAVSLLCLPPPRKDLREKEIKALLAQVPGLRQKIGGSSIPMEKYVAYKANILLQGQHVTLGNPLPIIELGYFMNAFEHSTPADLAANILPVIRSCTSTSELTERVVLKRFLEAVCLRYVAYPTPFAMLSLPSSSLVAKERRNFAAQSKEIFEWILRADTSKLITSNDWVVYWSHYELGALLICLGEVKEGKKHYELILSGKPLIQQPSGRSGKYAMESALNMRTSACIESCK